MTIGSSIFSTEYSKSKIVDLEYVEPTTGVYKYGTERIPWSYKPLDGVFLLWLKTPLVKNENTIPYEHIDIQPVSLTLP
jgi:hypothetical protein